MNFSPISKLLAFSALLSTLLLAGCGRNGNADDFQWEHLAPIERDLREMAIKQFGQTDEDDEETSDEDAPEAGSPFAGQTISIAAYEHFFRDWNLRRFADQFRMIHPEAQVDIVRITPDEGNERDRLRTQLMAGTAPTVMQAALMGFPNLPSFGFFSDWLPLMDQHPHFVEDEWNVNLINAFRQDGRLLAFPASATVTFVVANSNVPDLVEEFSKLDSVTMSELMDMHDRFYEASGGMYFVNDHSLNMLFPLNLHSFFDYDSRTAAFDSPDFIAFLLHMRDILPSVVDEYNWWNREQVFLREQTDMFRLLWGFNELHHFDVFDIETVFVHPIPITNDMGEVILAHYAGSSWYKWLLNAGASQVEKAMAMELILIMARVFDNDTAGSPFYFQHNPQNWFWAYTDLPARRDALARGEEGNIQVWRNNLSWHWDHPLEILDGAVERLIQRKQSILDGSFTLAATMPSAVSNLINEAMNDFLNGAATAEETATRLQNSVTLALLEQE